MTLIPMFRNNKQMLIVCAYIVLFAFLAYGAWNIFLKSDATCLDGIKNQNEEQIDCGGVCGACQEKPQVLDMQIQETGLLDGGRGEYDAFAKIYNPNDRFGASAFTYTLILKNSAGEVVAEKSDQAFILPKETKYLMQTGISASSSAANIEVKIENQEWQTFSGYQEKPALNVYSKRYGPVSSGVGFGEAFGIVSNESGFDFRSIIVKVLLRDASGKPLALNMTEMRTVTVGERREFHLIWPTGFLGSVEKVEVETEADVYHSDNFIKRYLPGGSFQQF